MCTALVPLLGLRHNFCQLLGLLVSDGSQVSPHWEISSAEENDFAQSHDPPWKQLISKPGQCVHVYMWGQRPIYVKVELTLTAIPAPELSL